MKLQTAVLSDKGLHLPGKSTVLEMACPPRAGVLCEIGLAHNIQCIWVLPGSHLSQQIGEHPGVFEYASSIYDLRLQHRDKTEIPTFGSIKRKIGTWEEKRLVDFAFPEHDPKWMNDNETWALADIEDPIELLRILTTLEEGLTPRRVVKGCLEMDPFFLAWSPGHAGISLLKKVTKMYSHAFWMREADLSQLPACIEPGGFLWKRPLLEEERAKKYAHFYDRNAQFIASCTGAELGEGTPEPIRFETPFPNDMKLPGVWDIEVWDAPKDPRLPEVMPLGRWQAYTPTVNSLKSAGYSVSVHGGWQWPIHHRTLQEWAKHLWGARLAAQNNYGKGSPQDQLIKMISNRSLGWLDLGVVRSEQRTAEQYHRPDWYNIVRALARFRMMLKIQELAAKGFFPVMIVADNIMYLSDDPNPETAIPDLMRRKEELGGFKHDGTYLLSDIAGLLDVMEPNAIRHAVKLSIDVVRARNA